MSQASAFLIAGPTASGKSAFALDLAERVGGTIVNADSMQVYADLSIINARPSAAEMQRVPHLLFGHVDAALNYSVGHWLSDATRALVSVHAAGRVPIFVGGTGLYFKALTQGLSAIPNVPETIRAAVRAEGIGLSPTALHAKLYARDPVTAANLRPSDPQRILRALEVFEATGRSLASFQAARGVPLLDVAGCTALFLAPDRPALRARIDARFEAMLAAGAMREVEALMRRNLDPALPAMRAHGIPHLMRHLRGDISYAAAVEEGQRDTRHYARRQFTFARHQLPAFVWRAPEEARATLDLHARASRS